MEMRMAFFTLLLFGLFSSFGQNSEREKELIAIEQNQDSITRLVFLDSTELTNLKLLYSGKTRQIWRSTSRVTQNIEQFYDIRLQFESKKKALAFHKDYWRENSEFGPEIKKHKINIDGADAFRVFKGENMVNQMIERFGLQMYCYLFVVDNYFVKFYISCKAEFEPTIIQPYLTKVIAKIIEHRSH